MASKGRENLSPAQLLAAPDTREDVPDAPLTSSESDVVLWDGEDDPENPLYVLCRRSVACWQAPQDEFDAHQETGNRQSSGLLLRSSAP